MYLHWAGLGLLAVFICLGLFYRYSMALFFLGYTYCFLLEQARYQNHYYLICLVSFLMIFVPANAAFSLDVKLGLRERQHRVAAWPRLLLMGQVGAVYFFGGIAKINPDWLRGGAGADVAGGPVGLPADRAFPGDGADGVFREFLGAALRPVAALSAALEADAAAGVRPGDRLSHVQQDALRDRDLPGAGDGADDGVLSGGLAAAGVRGVVGSRSRWAGSGRGRGLWRDGRWRGGGRCSGSWRCMPGSRYCCRCGTGSTRGM